MSIQECIKDWFGKAANGLLPSIALTVCHDPANDSRMAKFGNGFQNSLMKGAGTTENHCYVNFALNSNSAEQMYGSGEKLEKLKTLKRKWDRNGRFSFYRPIC